MKAFFVVWLLLTMSIALLAQETAHVTIACSSLRFRPATAGGQTLSFTTDSSLQEINNELAPTWNFSLPDHGSNFVLYNRNSAGSVTGQLFFSTPGTVDGNNDGFDDFFQVGQAVAPTTTQGQFSTALGQGTVTANWSRAAGSSTGTCTVQLTGQTLGQLPAFTFTFELLTYTGRLTYTPTTNSITGSLNLTNVVSSSNLLTGPVTLVRVGGTNRFNELTLLPSTLMNANGQSLSFTAEDMLRDTTERTNYYGSLDFGDFDLTTSTPDYQNWTFSIDDLNDANRNGIPDLSDDPGGVVPQPPVLNLSTLQTAHATIVCKSLRFPPATANGEKLSITSDASFSEINNELAPTWSSSLPSYGSLFKLYDSTGAAVTGKIYFDTPPPVDANNDGFDDFLQVGQAVAPTTTQGEFSTAVDQGTVTANWSRDAGSSTGTCTVQMTGQTFGQLPAFTFTFELLTYTGTLRYTATTNSINGLLNLTNVESSSDVLTDLMTLIRVGGTNRFNELTLLPGALTNVGRQQLTYVFEDIGRDTDRLTNYYSYLDFADFDLTTSTSDYTDWMLSIDDLNDANANGIPDLSDDPVEVTPLPPLLSLSASANRLLFRLNATVGQTYNLEEIVSLAATNWQNIASITVTNNPQTLSLPIPNTTTAFWRLRAP